MIKRKVNKEIGKIQQEPSSLYEPDAMDLDVYRDMDIMDDGDYRPVSAVLTQPQRQTLI